jgi:hypothetical protein
MIHAMREATASRSTFRGRIFAGAAAAIVLGGAVWLWAHYGTAVFFETIRAGFIACFG